MKNVRKTHIVGLLIMSLLFKTVIFKFQVLLLADNIVVKQLLLDKETNTVGSVCIKHMNNFSEFVKAFCDFGQEMVELTVMTRWHLNQAWTQSQTF